MRTRPLGLMMLWVSVTAVLTVTAWLAVQVVADGVAGEQPRVLTAAAVRAAASSASTLAPTSSAAGVPSPTATAPSEASSPTRSPSPKPSSTGGGGGSRSTSVTKTFSVQGGTVAAACMRAKVSLQSAQPKNGWSVEVKDRGPEHLEIAFRSGESETEVKIRCSGGTPVIESESDDSGSDD